MALYFTSDFKMIRSILTVLLICQILVGCFFEDNEEGYKYIGEVSFRKTYAGHENFSDTELDSLDKTNPVLIDPIDTSEDSIFTILTQSGLIDKSELLLNKITSTAKDTIFIATKKSLLDTIYIDYEKNKESGNASIKIRNEKAVDSIAIKDEVFSHTFSLVKLTNSGKTMFAFVNQYYIINGDNYEVLVYEKR